MRRPVRIAGCLPVLLGVLAGCSTSASPANDHPPVVAAAASCQKAGGKQPSGQPVEIVVVEKQGGSSAGERYLTRFQNLNSYCVPTGTGGLNTDWFTFTPNVTAGQASKVADEMRSTGLFARVTEMTVPLCTTPHLLPGSCTPPTIP